MTSYPELLREHTSLPAFSPLIPTSLLQPLAFTSFGLAFIFAFYFTTLRSKGFPKEELAVGGAASLMGGFGMVFAFCAVGVNV